MDDEKPKEPFDLTPYILGTPIWNRVSASDVLAELAKAEQPDTNIVGLRRMGEITFTIDYRPTCANCGMHFTPHKDMLQPFLIEHDINMGPVCDPCTVEILCP